MEIERTDRLVGSVYKLDDKPDLYALGKVVTDENGIPNYLFYKVVSGKDDVVIADRLDMLVIPATDNTKAVMVKPHSFKTKFDLGDEVVINVLTIGITTAIVSSISAIRMVSLKKYPIAYGFAMRGLQYGMRRPGSIRRVEYWRLASRIFKSPAYELIKKARKQ